MDQQQPKEGIVSD
jgi:hypothetical protein